MDIHRLFDSIHKTLIVRIVLIFSNRVLAFNGTAFGQSMHTLWHSIAILWDIILVNRHIYSDLQTAIDLNVLKLIDGIIIELETQSAN